MSRSSTFISFAVYHIFQALQYSFLYYNVTSIEFRHAVSYSLSFRIFGCVRKAGCEVSKRMSREQLPVRDSNGGQG
jgi:hypothetical protein